MAVTAAINRSAVNAIAGHGLDLRLRDPEAVGDPLNGAMFDLFDGYRPLFLMMAAYTALAFVAVLFVPRGAGEADTGPDAGTVQA